MNKRILNKIYAKKHGYFWLPCPKCGEMFGGHEIGKTSVPTDQPGLRRICCKKHDNDKHETNTVTYEIKPIR